MIQSQLDMPKLVTTSEELIDLLLKNRGIKTDSQKEKFFHPRFADFVSVFELPGIDVAKNRILGAIKNDELIIVYGDYDVDGLSATAILYHTITSLGGKVLPHIPHREKEGYGLSKIGLDEAKAKGASLVITVDNGIVANKAALYAQSLGLDLIITDHHLPSDQTPEALAIVHSTKLCGAGVAWALARALLPEPEAEKLLDLVALATICDMMPLVEVNRWLVIEGLKVLKKTNRVGLLSLINECKLDKNKLNSYHLSYILGPRINSVGRLDSALDGLRLLCTKDPVKGQQLAKNLCASNDAKKQLMTDAITQVKEGFKIESLDLTQKKILILQSKDWIPGIIGLVAGRIVEEYKLPTIVISTTPGHSKGSARSVDGLDIVTLIRNQSDILLDVGGHPKAAGFSIETEKIPEFIKRVEADIQKLELKLATDLEVEALLDLSKISKSWVKEIEKLEPFGVGNPRPKLGAVVKPTDVKTVGLGKHLKFKSDGVESIGFGFGELSLMIQEASDLTISYHLDINVFNDRETLQLNVSDIKLN